MFERETLYQMLFNKEWDNIATVMHKNPDLLGSDPVMQQAVKLFENEFFSETDSFGSKEKLNLFEYPWLVVENNSKAFTKEFKDRLIDERLIAMRDLKRDGLISFAASYQDRPLAREILKDFQIKKPESLADSARENTTVRATDTRSGAASLIKLFKSKQEEYFFEAIRKAFPTYHPYPNVALSSVLDYEKVKKYLTSAQKDYFFKAVLDSVVFDSSRGYLPLYFIELDSIYHDTDRARANDSMKDAIFEAANVKLIRIRPHVKEDASVDSFYKLVLELMRGL